MSSGRPPASIHQHRAVRRPTKHLGWSFSGHAEFEGRASSFLAQGAHRGERLVYVADDPNIDQWPRVLLDRGDLFVLSIAEVYGPDRIVVAASQRAMYEALVGGALHDGYSGIRVCADGTSLIAGPERLATWLAWEHEADQFISKNRMTALCSFDRTRADPESLQSAVGAHRAIAPPAPRLEDR